MREEEIQRQKIILFDGICTLCNGSVGFILRREKNASFLFASIQSETGKALLQWCKLPSNYNQAIVYLENGKIHLGSTAALKIGQDLIFPWSLLAYSGFVVPRFIRDWVYNLIAQHRYQWFGKKEVCMVPTESLKTRFL
jgi:predicted DCC family thiol-disulfide oxidoreductase YuxK